MKLQIFLLALVCTSAFGYMLKGGNEGDKDNNASPKGQGQGKLSKGETKQFCDDLPETDDMDTFNYHMTHCNDDATGAGCDKGTEDVDLSVIKHNIECFRTACGNDDDDAKQAAIDQCFSNLESQFKNLLQFTPEDYDKQSAKACSCKSEYSGSEKTESEDGKTSMCDLRWSYGCDPLGLGIEGTIPECLNAPSALYGKNECTDEAAEKNSTQDLMEYFRIKKLCEPSVKSMLMSERIVTPVCAEQKQRQENLIFGCTSQCFSDIKDRSYLSKYQYVSYDPEYSTEYFDEECGVFDGEDGETYYSKMVMFQGKQGIWEAVTDICAEFRDNENKKVPEPLRFSPITRNILTESTLSDALDKCCDARVEGKSPYSEPFQRGGESLDGKKETDCLESEGVLVDFGFMPSLLRGLISKYHGKDWRVCSEFNDKCTPTTPRTDGKKCARDLDKEDQMELGGGKAGADQIFWFLRYLEGEDNKVAKGYALKSCSDGARIGRTVTMLPGLSLGLEAQEYGLKADTDYQTVSMLSYYTCAVFASVHHNNYFNEDAECNKFAFDTSADRSTVCTESK